VYIVFKTFANKIDTSYREQKVYYHKRMTCYSKFFKWNTQKNLYVITNKNMHVTLSGTIQLLLELSDPLQRARQQKCFEIRCSNIYFKIVIVTA
jgi:hypothetical protein